MTYIATALIKTLVFTLTLFALSTADANTCNYYASPVGSGNGVSPSTPFRIKDFWSVVKPGQTLCLLDGVYNGSHSMIFPPENLNGISGAPITVRALNDGKVLINGAGGEVPIRLYHNSWFIIEGVNACCSNADVVGIFQSSNNIIRRVAGWNAADANRMIFALAGGTHNLLEDIAGWGIARKILESCCNANFTTVRRFWGRWDGSHFVGPKMTLSLAYNNTDMLVENSIGTWSGSAMKETYTLACDPGTPYQPCGKTFTNYSVDQPQGIFSIDGITSGDRNARSKLLGSIAYVQDTDRYSYSYVNLINSLDSITLENDVVYIKPGFYKNVKPFGLLAEGVDGNRLIADKLTSFGTSASTILGWRTSNILHGTAASAVYASGEGIFNANRGANLCYAYQDGTRTTKALWPWPMDQRIKEAMAASGHRSVTYGMETKDGLVTTAIEQMFGKIPANCKAGVAGNAPLTPPSAPINLEVQTQG